MRLRPHFALGFADPGERSRRLANVVLPSPPALAELHERLMYELRLVQMRCLGCPRGWVVQARFVNDLRSDEEVPIWGLCDPDFASHTATVYVRNPNGPLTPGVTPAMARSKVETILAHELIHLHWTFDDEESSEEDHATEEAAVTAAAERITAAPAGSAKRAALVQAMLDEAATAKARHAAGIPLADPEDQGHGLDLEVGGWWDDLDLTGAIASGWGIADPGWTMNPLSGFIAPSKDVVENYTRLTQQWASYEAAGVVGLQATSPSLAERYASWLQLQQLWQNADTDALPMMAAAEADANAAHLALCSGASPPDPSTGVACDRVVSPAGVPLDRFQGDAAGGDIEKANPILRAATQVNDACKPGMTLDKAGLCIPLTGPGAPGATDWLSKLLEWGPWIAGGVLVVVVAPALVETAAALKTLAPARRRR